MLRKKHLAAVFATLLFLGMAPAAQAITFESHIVYLAGTAIGGKEAGEFQADWTPIANSLKDSRRLNIPVSRQVVVNYTNMTSIAQDLTNQNRQKPAVVSSFYSKSPSPIPGCRVIRGGASSITDAWAHAMTTAWAIRDYVVKNSNSNKQIRLLLIGHSQGGTIARILQLVVANKSGLPSDMPRKCWPYDTLSKAIVGIVGMGSPLSKAKSCEGFPDSVFPEERLYTNTWSGTSAGKVLMIGASPREEVYLPIGTPKINNECATNVKSKDSIRVNIFSFGYQTAIESVTVGKPYKVGNVSYRDATLITSTMHNLCAEYSDASRCGKFADSFAIVGAKPSYWNRKWSANSDKVVLKGTLQRTIVFRVPGSFSAPALPLSTDANRACDLNPKTPEALCLIHQQVQSHGWWVEGGGICPASIVKPGRGDGNTPTPFCGFVAIVNNSTSIWPTVFTPIYDLTSAGNPGTVYDLIASKTRSWLP